MYPNVVYIEKSKDYWICNSNNIWELGSIGLLLIKLTNEYPELSNFNKFNSVLKFIKVLSSKDLDFEDKLDKNRNLIGFYNGCYDIPNKIFRAILPEDNISMTCGYNLDLKPNPNIYAELERFITDILPEPIIRAYFLKQLSNCLLSRPVKLFHILTGGKDSGKSSLMTLVNKTLGDYAGKLDPSIFCNKSTSNDAPNPSIVLNMKKRFIDVPEFSIDEKLQGSVIKRMTGDTFTGRLLFSNTQVKMVPNWNLYLHTNDLPNIDAYDQALIARINIYQFNQEFVAIPIKENQKKIITSIDKNFEIWTSQMFNLLLEYLDIELEIPEQILEARLKYKDECNTFAGLLDVLVNSNNFNTSKDTRDYVRKVLNLDVKITDRAINKAIKVEFGEFKRNNKIQTKPYGWNVDFVRKYDPEMNN